MHAPEGVFSSCLQLEPAREDGRATDKHPHDSAKYAEPYTAPIDALRSRNVNHNTPTSNDRRSKQEIQTVRKATLQHSTSYSVKCQRATLPDHFRGGPCTYLLCTKKNTSTLQHHALEAGLCRDKKSLDPFGRSYHGIQDEKSKQEGSSTTRYSKSRLNTHSNQSTSKVTAQIAKGKQSGHQRSCSKATRQQALKATLCHRCLECGFCRHNSSGQNMICRLLLGSSHCLNSRCRSGPTPSERGASPKILDPREPPHAAQSSSYRLSVSGQMSLRCDSLSGK